MFGQLLKSLETTSTGVTVTGNIGATNFSGSSSGTNTGDQDLSSYLTAETFSSSDVVMSLSGTDVIAGESITLAGGLSYSGTTLTSANDNTTYTAGTGLTLTGTSFSVTANTYATAAQGTTADAALPKAGGTMTGALTIDTTGTALSITGNTTVDNSDVSIYLGNTPSDYGFYLKYVGSGGGNANAFKITSTNAGTPKTLLVSNQDGIVNFPTGLQLNGSDVATQSYVSTQISNLVDSAPATLDTLNELAAALGDDASFSTTVSTALGNRLRIDVNNQSLSSTELANARTNLGLGTAATAATGDFATAAQGTLADSALQSETFSSSDVVMSLSGNDVTAGESITLAGGLSYSGTTLTSADTTYTVGDGGLTQNNFTTTLKNKLDGIAAGATNVTNNNQLTNGAGYITGVTNISGYSGTLLRSDNRTIAPSEETAGRMKFGFTSWGNNNTSPYADFLHLRSYTDSSGGSDNLVMFKKSGIGMRIWQQTYGSATAYSTYEDVYHTGNLTIGDGGLTQKNFTTTLQTKLDGIEAGATNVTNNNQLTNGAGYLTAETFGSSDVVLSLSGDDVTAGESITLAGGLSYSGTTLTSANDNTTYTAGTGLTLTGTSFSVTANTYATAAQGATADSALQPGDADLTPSWVPATDPSYLTTETFSSSDVVLSLSGTDVIAGDSITLAGGLSYNASTKTLSQTDNNTVYTHPTSAGNKHIPTGGSAGQFLKYSSSGTAVWATPSYTTNTDTQLSDSYVRGLYTGGTNVSITAAGVISSTNTTYSTADFDAAGSAATVQSNLDSVAANVAGISNQSNTDVDTGTETIAQVSKGTYTAAFFDFVIKNGTNVRAGTVYSCHDGTNVEFTETSTVDLGDTSDVSLSVDISGTNMRLRATTTSNNWSVKSLVRAI